MGKTKTYDNKAVTVSFGAKTLSGFGVDSKVKITYNAELFTSQHGVDGEHARSKMNNHSAMVELTLLQTSDDNDYLSAIALLDRQANAGIRPLSIVDGSGRTVISAKEAWIAKKPDVEFNREAGDRVWTIETGDVDDLIGGN